MKIQKRQHQTKENSQSSIPSFHVPVQAACITTVILTVDCSTRWLVQLAIQNTMYCLLVLAVL